MTPVSFTFVPVRTAAEINSIRRLFRDYAASLPIDLDFQDFESEVASLPGKYAHPTGELLLALDAQGDPIGCVAARQLAEGICEMKRLYVSPAGRGRGLGRALANAIMAWAAGAGYREIKLDTLSQLTEAVSLYEKLGFEPIPAYNDAKVDGILFLGRRLDR